LLEENKQRINSSIKVVPKKKENRKRNKGTIVQNHPREWLGKKHFEAFSFIGSESIPPLPHILHSISANSNFLSDLVRTQQ
jgi:hypothetical protein